MDIQKQIKRKWYFQGFNATPALTYGALVSALVDMWKTLGYGYSVIIEFFEHDKCYFLYAWDDLFFLLSELKRHAADDKSYLGFLIKRDREICRRAVQTYNKAKGLFFPDLSYQEMESNYLLVQRAYASVLSVSHLVEGFTLTTEEEIRRKASSIFSLQEMSLLMAPPRHSFISTERYELAKLASEIKQRDIDLSKLEKYPDIHFRISSHRDHYFWKNDGYSSTKDLSMAHFVQEIGELLHKDMQKIISSYESLSSLRVKRKLLLQKASPELKNLLLMNDTIFELHDHRKEMMTYSLHVIELFLKELSRRTGIPLHDLRYIMPDEISRCEKLGKELAERRKKCIIFHGKGKYHLFTREKADTYITALMQQMKPEPVTIIKGNIASPGIAQGKVKVCRGESEISKVEKGDILVACMTQPEFVPAMRKAAAVITDEGGLTCHAAIISRELSIPCIIGTKIATQVLKDG